MSDAIAGITIFFIFLTNRHLLMIQRYSIIVFVTLLALYLLSCSTSSELDELTATWKVHGLDSAAVHSIHQRNGKLYAGTNRGVFISTDSERTSWSGPKLDNEGIKHISLALGEDQKIIAAIQYEPEFYEEENEILFESTNDGESWEVINETVKGLTRYGQPVSSFISLSLLIQHPSDRNELYAYNGVISRSADGGKNWEVVFNKGGFSFFLKISKYHPKHIWTGGTKPIPYPYFAKSEDGGETWTDLSQHISFNADATATAAAVSPRNPDVGLVGFISSGPAIRKTQDGGQTWRTVLKDYRVYALQNSLRASNRVYGSGNHPSSKPTVVVSDNYGDNWTTFVHKDGPERMWVNDMAVAEMGGQEVVFLGTTKGVYSFRLEE